MKNLKYSVVAVKTAYYFFIFGFLWILLSDTILHRIVNSHEIESTLQTFKGWVFISITAILIYQIVRYQVKMIVDLNYKLTISEKNLSAVLENIGEGIIYTDPSGNITEMNVIAEKITGYSEHEAAGKPLNVIFRIGKENSENAHLNDPYSSNGGSQGKKYYYLQSKDGIISTIYSRNDQLVDEDGNVTGTIIAFKDVTESIAREKALLASENRMRALVETSHDLIWSSDSQGVITYINEASNSIYGRSPEEMIGRNFSEFVSGPQMEKNQNIFIENFSKGKMNIEFEGQIVNKNGDLVYVKDNAVALMDEKGNLQGILGATKDITGKKKAEKALMENKERLELALSGGGLATWDFVLSSNSLIVNDYYKDMLGLEIEGNVITVDYFLQLIHPDELQLILESLQGAIKYENEKFDIEFRMRHSNGSIRWIHSMGKVAERNEEKKVSRLIGVNQDVTIRKNLEIELQRWVNIYESFIKYSSEGIYLFEMNEPMPVDLTIEEQIKQFYHNGKIILCNDSFAKMYGYSQSSELVGTGLVKLHGGDNKPENLLFLRKFVESNYRVAYDITKEVDKKGNTIYISNNAIGIIENNSLVRIWGSQLDISDQVEAHNELELSELRYRLLFETNPVPLVIFDIDKFYFYDVNQAAEELLEYSKQELLTQTIRNTRPDVEEIDDDELLDRINKELMQTNEFRLKTKSGKLLQVEVKSDMIDLGDKRAVLAAINDLTSLRETEKKVLQSLIEGEDNERRRVARELHDSLGQSLTAASLNFDSVIKSLALLNPERAEKFKTGMTFLNLAIEESRNIAHNLMPQAIEDFGLVPALKSLFTFVEKTTGINIEFYENLENYRLNKQTELNIYRITQEALNNTLKHAGASEIFIQIILHPNEIIYTFEDNGKGFSLHEVKPRQKGMGISSMYNRALAMSGVFEIESEAGTGTSITIQIPNV